jgi:hypothetical protein
VLYGIYCIAQHLEMKFLDHDLDGSYPISDIYGTAKYIPHGMLNLAVLHHHIVLTTLPIALTISLSSLIKVDDLSVLFSQFARSLVKALAPEETKPASSPMPMLMTSSSLFYQITPAPIQLHPHPEPLTSMSAMCPVLTADQHIAAVLEQELLELHREASFDEAPIPSYTTEPHLLSMTPLASLQVFILASSQSLDLPGSCQ